mgnify:CR=1 FL=1
MGRRSLLDRLLPPKAGVDRRTFLGGLGGLGAVACATGGKPSPDSGDSGRVDSGDPIDPDGTCSPGAPTATSDTTTAGDSPFSSSPFGLGVASGDPLHDRVILWTRLVEEPTNVAASPTTDADVVWQLAADEAFSTILQEGMVTTTAAQAHSVHVDVDGLDSETEYFYRFICGAHESPIGRTRTLPCPDAHPEQLRLGFAVCQNWRSGFYASHRHMAEARVDLVVFLGDYIYESGDVGDVRDHGAPECMDLSDYRNRHGLYRSDEDLQAAHASAPWVPIWDDHELDNNCEGSATDDAALAARRAAAYQAWYEHMPVRQAPAADGSLQIHRAFDVGALARIVLLDGRQHRDPQPCGDDIGATCPEVSEDRTLLGTDQEAWVDDQLTSHDATWVVVANPVVMLPIDLGGTFLNPDQWDGYPLARQRFLDAVAAGSAGRTVLFTGDIHAAGVGVVPEDPSVYDGPAAVAEIVVPPTSSRFTHDLADTVGTLLSAQEHIEWWDWTVNGWTEAILTKDSLHAVFWLVDEVTDPASDVQAARSWTLTPGDAQPVETTR